MAVAVMSSSSPPSYSYSHSHRASYQSTRSSPAYPSPQYSPQAGRSELVLDSLSTITATATNVSNQDYVYCTKSLSINLGPKIWGTSAPSYGGGAVVEGTALLSGDLKHVSSVSLKVCCVDVPFAIFLADIMMLFVC